MPGLTFISYSRRQDYFAESLTLHLQQRGLPVWFDLQQIEPGVNWQADIQDGLDRCHSMTLVASKAAFRSPYVAREWQAALDAGRPVYMVRYESVRLPKALRQRGTLIDFRHDFQQGADRLAGCLADDRDQRACSDGRPAGWRTGLPRGVRRMAFALALSDIALMGDTFLTMGSLALQMNPGVLPRMLLDGVLPESAAQIAWLARVGLLILAIAGLVSRQCQWRKAGRCLRHDFAYEDLQKQLQIRHPPGGALWALGVVGLSYGLWQTDLLGQNGLPAELGIVGLPLLMYLLLCLLIQAPALVNLRDHALGMPRLRLPWKSILYLMAGAAALILLPSFSK